MHFISPYLGLIIYKIILTPKCKIFNVPWVKLQVKGGLNNLFFSIGFQMLKI